MGNTLRELGSPAQAVTALERARATRERELGAEHPATLTTLHNLALAYQAAGRPADAIALYEHVRDARMKELGAEHLDTLMTLNNLAGAYWSARQLDRSIPLFEDVLKRLEKKLGRQHPDTLLTVANLGVNYKDAGRLAEALPLLEEAYRAAGRHPRLRGVHAPLLDGYLKAGRTKDAVRLIGAMLADARKQLPKDSPQLAGRLAMAGLSLLQVHAFAEAEPLLRECLAIREKTQPDAWTTFNTMSLLGGVLLGQKKHAEAEPLLLAGFEGMKKREKTIPPAGLVRLREALDRLIELSTATNKPDEAKKWRAERAKYLKIAPMPVGEKQQFPLPLKSPRIRASCSCAFVNSTRPVMPFCPHAWWDRSWAKVAEKSWRKHLSVDALHTLLRDRFDTIPDTRSPDHSISLSDALMSGFALFALKEPSLLAFQDRIKDDNLRTIYGIQVVPSDTHLRTMLDPTDPESLRPCFTDIFRELQRGKALEAYVFYQGCYLLSIDGSGYFSSEKIHCPSCQERHHKNGKVTYSHQMLAGVLVHPDIPEVIPVMPEPINKQDGDNKNDCERNASKRFMAAFRVDHPHLGVIVIEDGLSSNGPHIEDLHKYKMHYILGAKQGDHAALFSQMASEVEAGTAKVLTLEDKATGTIHHFRWVCQVPLNKSHPDILVHMLEYWEINSKGKVQYFSWVTDLKLTADTVWMIMRGGRARWSIENETFNTLKNQGYHFEHNFGHGKQNLSVVFALLMMLAFLVDQVQQLCSALFRSVWQKFGTKRLMWDRMRSLFYSFVFDSMQELFEALLAGIEKQKPMVIDGS